MTTQPPPDPRAPSSTRLVLFLAITAISLWLMLQHFAAVSATVRDQGGSRLNEAGAIISNKLALIASHWKPAQAEPLAGRLREMTLETSKVFAQRIAQEDAQLNEAGRPGAKSEAERALEVASLQEKTAAMRAQYAILLLSLGERTEADKALAPLESMSAASGTASAIRAAFDLQRGGGASAGEAHPLPRAQAEKDDQMLGEIEGWQGTYAREALARRQKGVADADVLALALQQQADRVARQFLLVMAVFLINLLMGLAVLLFWLIKGRQRDLRSTRQHFDADGSEEGPARPAFDPLAGWSMLLAFQLVSIFGAGMLFALLQAYGAQRTPLLVVGLQLIIYAVMFLLIAIAINGRFEAIGVHARKMVRSLAAGLGLFWAAFIVVLVVGLVMSYFTQNSAQNNPVFRTIEESMAGSYQGLVLLALVALLGPLFEEILFRGVIYTSMRYVMAARLAIPLNGLVFSAVHGDLNTIIPLAVLGMLLAYGYERTRSVLTSAVCHCIWNAQTFLLFVTLLS